MLEGAYLEVLIDIFTTIASNPLERDILKLPDSSGACSVLGMLVANSKAAIDCCMAVYRCWPDMIAVPHLPGFFVGENAFHVLAVNSQEDALCELIQMAYDHLDRERIRDAFTSQALGLFFTGPPMNQYGGSPIGYAARSACARAIALYLSLSQTDKVRGFINLNDREQFCVFSGFSPMHAVVATATRACTTSWWTCPSWGSRTTASRPTRAQERRRDGRGLRARVRRRPHAAAARVRSSATTRCSSTSSTADLLGILWKWGPVTQFQIDLDGIDSAPGKRRRGDGAHRPLRRQAGDAGDAPRRLHGGLIQASSSRSGSASATTSGSPPLLDLAYLVPLSPTRCGSRRTRLRAAGDVAAATTLVMMMPSLEEDLPLPARRDRWYTSYSGPRDNIGGLFMTGLSSHLITNKLIG